MTVSSVLIEGLKEMFLLNNAYLTMHSKHLTDILHQTFQIASEETLLLTLYGLFFFYAPFYRQGSTYQGLCYTSHEALAGTRNS